MGHPLVCVLRALTLIAPRLCFPKAGSFYATHIPILAHKKVSFSVKETQSKSPILQHNSSHTATHTTSAYFPLAQPKKYTETLKIFHKKERFAKISNTTFDKSLFCVFHALKNSNTDVFIFCFKMYYLQSVTLTQCLSYSQNKLMISQPNKCTTAMSRSYLLPI